MQIRTKQLREALMLFDHVVPKKSTSDVIKHVLIKDGKITATDLEVFVTLDIPEVEGECLIPHRAVYDLIKYIPERAMLTIEQADKNIKVTWDDGVADFPTKAAADFPETPGFQFKAKGSLNGDKLVKGLNSVVGYCQTDGTKPILGGVALLLGPSIEVWGADGFRLACQKITDTFPVEENIVIPAETVRLLDHLWGKMPAQPPLANNLISQLVSKREVRLGISENGEKMVIRWDRLTVVSRLLTGKIPDYKRLIPENQPMKIRILGRELETGLARFKLMSKAKNKIIRCTWAEDVLTLSGSNDDSGSVSIKMAVQTEGIPGRVAIDLSYLTAFVKGKDGLVTVSATDEKQPVTLQYSNTPLVVVMPMFVKWDGDPEPEKEEKPEPAPENTSGEQEPGDTDGEEETTGAEEETEEAAVE